MTYENMTRRRVLCYGDSNTYGYDPARDGRYGDDERYPMVLQNLLGDGWSVVEEGLPGRTAVFDDAITEGMNGLALITPILMSHAPLDTVTIMLGTNDSKNRFDCSSYLISLGIVRLVKKALHTECWRDNANPDVLVIVPPSITPEYDKLKFREEMGPGCHERCAGIAARLKPDARGHGPCAVPGCKHPARGGMLGCGWDAHDAGGPQSSGQSLAKGTDGQYTIKIGAERCPTAAIYYQENTPERIHPPWLSRVFGRCCAPSATA